MARIIYSIPLFHEDIIRSTSMLVKLIADGKRPHTSMLYQIIEPRVIHKFSKGSHKDQNAILTGPNIVVDICHNPIAYW